MLTLYQTWKIFTQFCTSDNTFSRFDQHNYRANYCVPLLGQLVKSGVVIERFPVLWAAGHLSLSFVKIVWRASSLHDDFVTKRKLRLDYWATVVRLPSGNTQTFLLQGALSERNQTVTVDRQMITVIYFLFPSRKGFATAFFIWFYVARTYPPKVFRNECSRHETHCVIFCLGCYSPLPLHCQIKVIIAVEISLSVCMHVDGISNLVPISYQWNCQTQEENIEGKFLLRECPWERVS